MQAVVIPVTPFAQNCSLVWCTRTMEGAVIDPGGDLDKVLAEVDRHGVRLTRILLTHAHIDHAGGTAELARRASLPIVGPHPGDKFWIDGLAEQGRMFGFGHCETFEPDQWLDDGDRVRVGDVLFQGSIGRTDFPGGDYATLVGAIRDKLFPLGDDVRFVPGHGPMSTFGQERRSNPFVGDAAVAKRERAG